MKEENKNIDKFFADRLAQNQAEEDWQIPSDEIWLAAKPHFAKKKKKKKKFIFWLIGTSAIILTLLIFDVKSIIKKEDRIPTKTNTIVNNNAQRSNAKTSSNTYRETNTEEESIDNENIKILNENVDKSNLFTNNEPKGAIKYEKSISNGELKSNVKVTAEELTLTEQAFNNSSIVFDDQSGVVMTKGMPNTATKAITVTEKIPVVAVKTKALENNRNLIAINNLSRSKVMIEPEFQKDDLDKIAPLAFMPIIPTTFRPKNELGVSTSKYILETILNNEVLTDPSSEIKNLNTSFININASHRKWYNRNISYVYGLNVTNIGLNFDLDALDTLDQNISTTNNTYEISTRRTAQNINIELKEGIELLEGDIINVKGNIGLNLLAVQVPFMIDYHLYKNKFEYLFGVGISLDVMHVSQEEINISIFKQQQMVNKPLKNNEISEYLYDYSLYGSLGARYHINKNWNLGISTKISILEPIFSYAEIGIYHRWHS